MSDDIYNRPRSPWAKIRTVLVGVLVAMLVLAFAVWGIEDVFRPNGSNAIVKVGDAEISQPEFMDRFNTRMQELAQEQGEGLTNQQAFDRGIPQQLVARLQNDLAIEADAGDLGVDVNNRDVRRYVENIDAFRNEITQQFDEAQLENLLRSNRIGRAEFEDDIVRVLTQRQTLPAIMGGIRAPRSYAESYNTFVNEIRRARVIRLNEGTLDTLHEPTDDELRSYIAANKSRFTAPEYRRVLVLRLDPQDFAGNDPTDPRFSDSDAFPPEMFDIYITEDQIRDRYDLLVDAGQLGAKETRDVALITASSEDQANVIAARINAGESAADVAGDLGLPTPDVFETVEEDGLINAASSALVYTLEDGAAGVAPTEFGTFEVVQVTQVNAASIPDFDAERERLHRELIDGEARGRIADLEKTIDDLILDGNTVEEIAEEIGFPLQSYPYIDRNGITQDDVRLGGFSRLPGLAQDKALLNAIFGADVGFESEIIPTVSNGLAVFRVTDIIDPEAKPFEDIRDQAATAVRAEQLSEALTAQGIDVAARIRNGEDMTAIASQLGVDIRELALQRANPPREYSPQMLVGLLDGDIGDVARGPGAVPGTYDVAILDTVSNTNERIGGQLLRQIQDNVSEQIALDVSNAYTTAILNDHEGQVFEDLMRSALALDDTGS